ncbi:hypothetical protein GP486_002414 [Trichoglossum hirsutum]|uniref:Serine hydrolase domain-containing protein n=1 Tax=Trichoglossum hirsutum TaxID=265104 RepID=A0A9P8RS40_9PEZI|nr:hypothetical protein GP486_002414 [Trichoglossum hirsutum]
MKQKILLPRILCVHGGGSNAAIFHAQTRFIRHALRDHFEFVFVDAPFECDAGPGVLPAFEGCGPYFRWTALKKGEDEGAAAWKVLRRLVEGPGSERIVGLLGFSQGVRAVMGLLLRQQAALYPTARTSPMRLRFAVCAMGGEGHPLRLADMRLDEAIRIPTIHVHGTQDYILPQSKRLLKRNFDQSSVKVLTVDASHHLPKRMDENARLADMMLEAWLSGGGNEAFEGDLFARAQNNCLATTRREETQGVLIECA